jgi:hypothetical protein
LRSLVASQIPGISVLLLVNFSFFYYFCNLFQRIQLTKGKANSLHWSEAARLHRRSWLEAQPCHRQPSSPLVDTLPFHAKFPRLDKIRILQQCEIEMS